MKTCFIHVSKPCVSNQKDADNCRGSDFSQLQHMSEYGVRYAAKQNYTKGVYKKVRGALVNHMLQNIRNKILSGFPIS